MFLTRFSPPSNLFHIACNNNLPKDPELPCCYSTFVTQPLHTRESPNSVVSIDYPSNANPKPIFPASSQAWLTVKISISAISNQVSFFHTTKVSLIGPSFRLSRTCFSASHTPSTAAFSYDPIKSYMLSLALTKSLHSDS